VKEGNKLAMVPFSWTQEQYITRKIIKDKSQEKTEKVTIGDTTVKLSLKKVKQKSSPTSSRTRRN